jgi:tRNA threonylcarbamoyladenosine biosynthesis protein TsaB
MTSQSKAINGTLLAIDTSTSSMSIALTRGEELLGELNSKAERNHSIHLIPMIQQLLSSAHIQPHELDAFAVGVGPGSYTGVRIGVTVAKTFAWANSMALLGVSSLEALALGGGEAFLAGTEAILEMHAAAARGCSAMEALCKQSETIWLIPMLEARRGQAYTGVYRASSKGWSCLAADGIRLMSTWCEQLLEKALQAGEGEALPDRILFVGETELHAEALAKFFESWPGASGIVNHEIQARHIAEIGQSHWKEGRIEQAHGLVPNYTQLTEAEVNLLAKKS